MALTLEQVNAIRLRMGEAPLTELPTEAAAPIVEDEEEKKRAADAEAEKNKPQPEKPVAPAEAVLDDQAVLKYLGERGISVSSINDLHKPPTQEDAQKKAEERENAKLTYGLNKGLFNRKTHEQFILERNSKQDLVYSHYYHEAKKEDPSLTDEDIQTEFADKYGLSAEPNTRRHKRGQQEIDLLGDLILRNKYANIYKLDDEYESYESGVKRQQEFENKIKQQAPLYKKDVEDIFSELKKITTKFGDDEQYEVELVEDSLSTLKSTFLNADFVAKKISEGYTKEALREVAFTALLSQNWPTIAKKIAEQMLHKQQKGVKGIIPAGATSSDQRAEISETQRKILERTFPNQPVVAN